MTAIAPERYPNLIPDSPLHRHLVNLLLAGKGKVPVQRVCEQVLLLRGFDADASRAIVSAFLSEDPRFSLNGKDLVEWASNFPQSTWDRFRRFAVFDLEVASEGKQEPRIMEVGFTFVEDGEIIEEWSTLVNPHRRISPYVRRLTGIQHSAVRHAPDWEEVLPRVLEGLGDGILVAHQARFDYDVLNQEISRLTGYRLLNPYICTVEMSRDLLEGNENYKLETLSQWLHLTHTHPHRAGSDARATAELLLHMLHHHPVDWKKYLRPLLPTEKTFKKRRKARSKSGRRRAPEAESVGPHS